jgi:hypothetical protein
MNGATINNATTKDVTMNACYNEQFLTTKSGYYNENICYNEHRGILLANMVRVCE